MRLKLKRLATGFGLLFVLLVVASAAMAEAPGGKFTLPFDASWGGTVLPAGTYTFSVVSTFAATRYLDIRGKKFSAFVLAASIETGTTASTSHLTAVTIGEHTFIERLDLKEGNLTMEFRLPKNARTPAQFTRLMVSHAGQGS